MNDSTHDSSSDEERLVIYVRSGISRGKYAAAAVHAALMHFGVHPGTPVIVLGAKPSDLEGMSTVVVDAGRTEVEPGTVTAGTNGFETERPAVHQTEETER